MSLMSMTPISSQDFHPKLFRDLIFKSYSGLCAEISSTSLDTHFHVHLQLLPHLPLDMSRYLNKQSNTHFVLLLTCLSSLSKAGSIWICALPCK